MKKTIFILISLIVSSWNCFSQTDNYYYYKNEKITINVNEKMYYILMSDSAGLTNYFSNSSFQVTERKSGTYFDKTNKKIKKYWKIIEVISMNANQKEEVGTWLSKNPSIERICPVIGDKYPVAVSEYFYVKIKLEDDFKILDSIAGKMSCELVGEVDDVDTAMQNYFGFQTIGIRWKDDFSSTWVGRLKSDINSGYPIYYQGLDTIGVDTGHAWVVDGYDINGTFHCNWGWGGDRNDWYTLSALNPYPSSNYNIYQAAIACARPILDACSGLDGADIVCSSNESYSVSIPSIASVEWSKTDNLNQVGVNTGTTYTVNSASSGQGGVTATIKNSHGQTFLTRSKYLWSGTPVIIGLDGPMSVPTNTDTRYYPLYGYQIASPSNFNWIVYPDDGVSYDSYWWSTLVNYTYPGTYHIIYRGLNTCGWGDWYYSDNIYVYSSRSLVIMPNPSSVETTISVESGETALDETAEWELEVYDNVQNLKEKKTKLKGKSTTINTQSWKEGVYLIRAVYKDEILTGKLVVKK